MTPDQARLFFLYSSTDDVREKYASLHGIDVDDLQLSIDWGTDADGQIIGGDIFVGPDRGATRLTDAQLVELALAMGGDKWDRPIYAPFRIRFSD